MTTSHPSNPLADQFLRIWFASLDVPIRTSALLTTASARLMQLGCEALGHAVTAQQPLQASLSQPQQALAHLPRAAIERQQRMRDTATVYLDIVTHTSQEFIRILADVTGGHELQGATGDAATARPAVERRHANTVIAFPDRRVALHIPPILNIRGTPAADPGNTAAESGARSDARAVNARGKAR